MSGAKTDREMSIESTEFEWDSSGFTEVHRFVLPVLRKWLSNRETQAVLDLGCGNGVVTNYLTAFCSRCVGIDMSTSGIEIASKNFPLASFEVAALDRPLPKMLQSSFDLVIGLEVIEHLLLPRQIFERAKEALKPGGELILSTPYHGYWKNLALAFAGKFDSHWHPLRDYGHVKFFSRSTLCQLYREQGFDVTDFSRVGRIPLFARSMIVRGKLR